MTALNDMKTELLQELQYVRQDVKQELAGVKEDLAGVINVTAAVVEHIAADGLEKEMHSSVERNVKLDSIRGVVRHMLGPLGVSAADQEVVVEALVHLLQVRYTCVWERGRVCVLRGSPSPLDSYPKRTHPSSSHTHV